MNRRVTVAITGASGVIYAVRLLRYFLTHAYEVDFIISDAGKINFKVEMDWDLDKKGIVEFLKNKFGHDIDKGKLREWPVQAIAAPMASGSMRRLGMVVVPCSMKTLSGIAHGASTNLIERAADVALKENFPLIIVPRETPMNSIQIENMLTLSKAGARIVPAMPAFYQKPQSIDDIADFIVARILHMLGIDDHELFQPWGG